MSLHVPPPVTVQIHERLPMEPDSAARARRLLERLEAHIDPLTLANAQLLVTELIANAIEHVEGDGEIELDVRLHGDRLRICVQDPGPGFKPQPRRPDSPADSGWGLHFVDQLAERWAVEHDARSEVWFELKV